MDHGSFCWVIKHTGERARECPVTLTERPKYYIVYRNVSQVHHMQTHTNYHTVINFKQTNYEHCEFFTDLNIQSSEVTRLNINAYQVQLFVIKTQKSCVPLLIIVPFSSVYCARKITRNRQIHSSHPHYSIAFELYNSLACNGSIKKGAIKMFFFLSEF